MATYGLIYTYEGANVYVRHDVATYEPTQVTKNAPKKVEAEHDIDFEAAVRAGLSKAKGIEVVGVRYSDRTINHRHALFAVFDLSVPEVA